MCDRGVFVVVVLPHPEEVIQSQADKVSGGGLLGAAIGGFMNAIVDSEETTFAVADRAKDELKKELTHHEIGASVDVPFQGDGIFVIRVIITDIRSSGLMPQCGPIGWGIFDMCLTQCHAQKPLRQTIELKMAADMPEKLKHGLAEKGIHAEIHAFTSEKDTHKYLLHFHDFTRYIFFNFPNYFMFKSNKVRSKPL